MAAVAFPSWIYNATLLQAQVVQTQAAKDALGTGWSFTPFAPPPPSGVPFDVGPPQFPITYPITDTRLQQILVEQRMLNMMFAQEFNIADDPITVLRPDIVANDSALAT